MRDTLIARPLINGDVRARTHAKKKQTNKETKQTQERADEKCTKSLN